MVPVINRLGQRPGRGGGRVLNGQCLVAQCGVRSSLRKAGISHPELSEDAGGEDGLKTKPDDNGRTTDAFQSIIGIDGGEEHPRTWAAVIGNGMLHVGLGGGIETSYGTTIPIGAEEATIGDEMTTTAGG